MNRSSKLVRPAKTPAPYVLDRVQLAENLDANLYAQRARCHPVIYTGSSFVADESVEWWCMYDGQNYGLESEWLWCVPYRLGGEWHYLPVSSGAAFHIATLSGDLAQGQGATASVQLPSKTLDLTVYDRWLDAGQKILSGSRVRIYYDRMLGLGTGARWTVDLTQCSQVD